MPPSSPAALPLDGSVVKMKGLPFKATAEDIAKFFSGFNLKTDNIYLKRHPDGRPNGEVSPPAAPRRPRVLAARRSAAPARPQPAAAQ